MQAHIDGGSLDKEQEQRNMHMPNTIIFFPSHFSLLHPFS